jgi:hypothetical protein
MIARRQKVINPRVFPGNVFLFIIRPMQPYQISLARRRYILIDNK